MYRNSIDVVLTLNFREGRKSSPTCLRKAIELGQLCLASVTSTTVTRRVGRPSTAPWRLQTRSWRGGGASTGRRGAGVCPYVGVVPPGGRPYPSWPGSARPGSLPGSTWAVFGLPSSGIPGAERACVHGRGLGARPRGCLLPNKGLARSRWSLTTFSNYSRLWPTEFSYSTGLVTRCAAIASRGNSERQNGGVVRGPV
jgi:hypothetical protein